MKKASIYSIMLLMTASLAAFATPQSKTFAPAGERLFRFAQTGNPAQPGGTKPSGDGKTSQGSESVKTLSPQSPISMPQDLGAFPTNALTNRPYVSPEGGKEGYAKTVAALQRTLTEMQQLQLEIKQAHWNVSGTLWYSLHLQLQEQYEKISMYADEVAERLLAIGSSADGRAGTIVRTSGIPEIPGGFLDDAQVISWFMNAYKKTGEEIRAGIKDTQEPDPTTSNLLQEVEVGIDKFQWQMRAHYQGTATDPNSGWDLNNNKPVDMPQVPADALPAK